jgi:hypothetical protein
MKKQLAIVAALLMAGGIAATVVPSLAQDTSSSALDTSSSFDCLSASSDMSAMSSDSSFMSDYSEYCPSSSSSAM